MFTTADRSPAATGDDSRQLAVGSVGRPDVDGDELLVEAACLLSDGVGSLVALQTAV